MNTKGDRINMNETPASLMKIRQLYPGFSGNYLAIADHILAHPEMVVRNKVRDIARECGCDDAQIIRFCQKIGYTGFSDLKAAIAADFIPVKLSADYSLPDGSDSFGRLKDDFRQNNLRALNDTVSLLDETTVQNAMTLLKQANRIMLCGFGSSGLVAQDFQVKLFRMGFNAFFNGDSELNRMYCGLLGENDVLIAISFSGENRNVCSYVEEVKKNGTNAIAITNFPESTLAKIADAVLLTASDEKQFRLGAMGSRIAQLLVVDFLSLELALHDMERTEENVIRTHKMVHQQQGIPK